MNKQQTHIHNKMINKYADITIYISNRLHEIAKIEQELFMSIENYQKALINKDAEAAYLFYTLIEVNTFKYSKYVVH